MRFVVGEQVQMTAETLKFNSGARSTTGVIVKSSSRLPEHVRVLRDGLKTVETWHESAWEKRSESEVESEHGRRGRN